MEQRQPAEHRLPGRDAGPLGDAAATGKLVGVGMRGDLRRAGGPAGVHERGQIARRRGGAGQAIGWLTGDHRIQVGHGHAGSGLAVGGQRWRDSISPVGAYGKNSGYPSRAAGLQHSLPELLVQFRPGGHDDAGSGPPDQRSEVLVAEGRVDGGSDPHGLRGQRRRVQYRGVGGGQRHRVRPPHPERGQRVGDLCHRAGRGRCRSRPGRRCRRRGRGSTAWRCCRARYGPRPAAAGRSRPGWRSIPVVVMASFRSLCCAACPGPAAHRAS